MKWWIYKIGCDGQANILTLTHMIISFFSQQKLDWMKTLCLPRHQHQTRFAIHIHIIILASYCLSTISNSWNCHFTPMSSEMLLIKHFIYLMLSGRAFRFSKNPIKNSLAWSNGAWRCVSDKQVWFVVVKNPLSLPKRLLSPTLHTFI